MVSYVVLRIFQGGAERYCQGREDIVTGVPGVRFANAAVHGLNDKRDENKKTGLASQPVVKSRVRQNLATTN